MIEIKEKEMCTGCYGCRSVCPQKCITMEKDCEGFYYPIVNKESCTNCGLCEKVCPIRNEIELQKQPVAYAAYNKNEKIRMQSSSGGLFTLIAEQILNDEGIVFGAGFDENFNVIHSFVECKEELFKFRGTKYVQSQIGDTYKQAELFLTQGKKVLFSGTPCQIAGLKLYLGKVYENLFCQDVICQGVPSPLAWSKYLENRIRKEGKGKHIREIKFRSKDESWIQYKLKISFEADIFYQEYKNNDKYLRAFMKFLTIRPCCFNCIFKGKRRGSDITLADFWGIQNVNPYMNDDKGISLVIINSQNGQNIINSIKSKMVYTMVEFQKAIESNPMYNKSIQYTNLRDKFFMELRNKDFDDVVSRYTKEPFIKKLTNKLKSVIRG